MFRLDPVAAFQLPPERYRALIPLRLCVIGARASEGVVGLCWPVGLPAGEDHGFCFHTSCFDGSWLGEAANESTRGGSVSQASQPDSPGAGPRLCVEDAGCGDYCLTGWTPNWQ